MFSKTIPLVSFASIFGFLLIVSNILYAATLPVVNAFRHGVA
jgi:hypothetical protein